MSLFLSRFGTKYSSILRTSLIPKISAHGRSHLGLVTIIVENYDTAIDYFTNKVGFIVHEDSPATKTGSGDPKRWVVIQRPGQRLPKDTGILIAQADGPEQHAMIGKQFAGRVGMFLYVDDFDTEYAKFQEAGVEFVGEPKEESYGKFVVFKDICGNKWDLIQPTGFEALDAFGRFEFFI